MLSPKTSQSNQRHINKPLSVFFHQKGFLGHFLRTWDIGNHLGSIDGRGFWCTFHTDIDCVVSSGTILKLNFAQFTSVNVEEPFQEQNFHLEKEDPPSGFCCWSIITVSCFESKGPSIMLDHFAKRQLRNKNCCCVPRNTDPFTPTLAMKPPLLGPGFSSSLTALADMSFSRISHPSHICFSEKRFTHT